VTGEERAIGGNKYPTSGRGSNIGLSVPASRYSAILSDGSRADVAGNQNIFHGDIHGRCDVGSVDDTHQAGWP
jgi:hypothetical protein